MPKILEEWTVLPHGPLKRIDESILTVTGDLAMPLGSFPRRMTVVRLRDGRTVIYSAIALDEREMALLEAFGKPSYLVVPNERHRMDAKIWKARYPDLVVLAPDGVKAKVSEVVAIDHTTFDFGDPDVRFVTVPGTEGHEAALVVTSSTGTSLVLNDLVWNVDDRPGFGGFLYHMLGMTGDEPRIPKLVELKGIKDKDALRRQLDAWASIGSLQRIIVSHGDIITREPQAVLARLGESLAA